MEDVIKLKYLGVVLCKYGSMKVEVREKLERVDRS